MRLVCCVPCVVASKPNGSDDGWTLSDEEGLDSVFRDENINPSVVSPKAAGGRGNNSGAVPDKENGQVKSKGTNPQVAKVVTCETALLQCHCYYCYLLMMRECLPRLTTHCLTCTSPRCINSPHCLGLDVAVMPTLSRQASSHKTFVDAQQKAFDSYGTQKRPRGVAMSPLPNGATSEGGIIPFFMMWS